MLGLNAAWDEDKNQQQNTVTLHLLRAGIQNSIDIYMLKFEYDFDRHAEHVPGLDFKF